MIDWTYHCTPDLLRHNCAFYFLRVSDVSAYFLDGTSYGTRAWKNNCFIPNDRRQHRRCLNSHCSRSLCGAAGAAQLSGLLQQLQNQGEAEGPAACDSQTASPFSSLNKFSLKCCQTFGPLHYYFWSNKTFWIVSINWSASKIIPIDCKQGKEKHGGKPCFSLPWNM